MSRALLVLAVAGCGAEADLSVRLAEDAFAVGEPVKVTLGGTVQASRSARVELSVFTEVEDDADLEAVTFTWVGSVPSGDASLVTDRSGINESEIAVVRLTHATDDVRATFEMTCHDPVVGRLLGAWRVESRHGAPIADGVTEGVGFTCE